MANYNEFSALPNNWFVAQTSAYDADRLLYDLLITESYNHNGVPLTYYVTTYNTGTDNYPDGKAIFGEDNNREFVRKFPIMAYYELPKELQMVNIFGIEGLDNFKMWVSMRHFSAASLDDNFNAYIPKEGDILHSAYNNTFYSIVDVGAEEEVFLQHKHSWEFTVERFKDTKISLTSATSADMTELEGVTDNDEDLFDISSYLISADAVISFETSADSIQPDSIWGEWS